MSTPRRFSLSRLWAIVVKEFIQMRRDRVTFGMMIGVPLIQLVLFGYAINADPKHLPTAVLLADYGPQGRTLLHAIRNSDYFEFKRELMTEQEGRDVLARGEVQFVVNIPQNFTRDLLRGGTAGDSRGGRRDRPRGHQQCDRVSAGARVDGPPA